MPSKSSAFVYSMSLEHWWLLRRSMQSDCACILYSIDRVTTSLLEAIATKTSSPKAILCHKDVPSGIVNQLIPSVEYMDLFAPSPATATKKPLPKVIAYQSVNSGEVLNVHDAPSIDVIIKLFDAKFLGATATNKPLQMLMIPN